MKKYPRSEDIYTPQGRLEEVEKNPNLDFLMNVFNIPRAFRVSGFGGDWNIGKHSFAAALIALYWARFNKFDETRKNRFIVLVLLHDLHEAVTGDILPMLKTDEIKTVLNRIQSHILKALGVIYDESLEKDIKIADIIAFLYEIRQVSPNILHKKQLELANMIADRQRQNLFTYCEKHHISKTRISKFLRMLELQ